MDCTTPARIYEPRIADALPWWWHRKTPLSDAVHSMSAKKVWVS